VADDPRVAEKTVDVPCAEARDDIRVEPRERLAERRPLAQDREPRETRLEALEAETLVDPAFGGDGAAPLLVVIREVARIVRLPAANDYSDTSTRTIPSSTVTGYVSTGS
jgi:hypothetical protein